MVIKLAKIELEVSHPDNCPHARVWRDYTTHDLSRIECVYPYVRTCIPPGTDLGNKLDCAWFKGNDQRCPLYDVIP